MLQRVANALIGNLAGTILNTQDPDPVAQSIRMWIAAQEESLRKWYTLYEQYYEGEHRTQLTRRLRQFLPRDLDFRVNFCEVVVDALVERLRVASFNAPESDKFTDWIQEMWAANRMDMEQITVHTEAVMKGDGYVLVDFDADEGRPRFTFQPADTIVPRYNSMREIVLLSKKWEEPDEDGKITTRQNLYYPERLEKYILAHNVWQRWQDEGDDAWPLKWEDKAGGPLGVPVIHFRNRPAANDFGRSELGNVVPVQDILNKTIIDLVMILDTMGFPQRWTIGIDAPQSKMSLAIGSVWVLKSDAPEHAKVGQFETAEVKGPLEAIEALIQWISGISRTPQHLFKISGNFPSGEALKTAEAGLVHKARLRQVGFGNSWENVIKMGARVAAAFGGGDEAFVNMAVETNWADVETRNEEEFIAGLAVKRDKLGVPQEQIWREMGYTQDEIDQMKQDIQEERVAQSNVGAEILRRFERGEEGAV